MDVRLLGPVGLSIGGREIPVGGPRQRCVLAVLAMTPGKPVSAEAIVERVWGDDLPGGVRSVLYSYISRLRRVLEAAGGGRAKVRRTGQAYLLEVEPQAVDLYRARDYAAQARSIADQPAGDLPRAAELLGMAYEKFVGMPLAGVGGDWVDRTRQGIERERLAVATDLFEVELRVGRHAAAIGPLSGLLADHPYAESVVGLLMLALHRCGRQAEALELYARTRRGLVEEIGDEPGAQLRRLHEQILRRDPALMPAG